MFVSVFEPDNRAGLRYLHNRVADQHRNALRQASIRSRLRSLAVHDISHGGSKNELP